jgi:tetratricopeptide (TPR) repeat protein
MRYCGALLWTGLILTAAAGLAQIDESQEEAEDLSGVFGPAIPRTISVGGQILLDDGTVPLEPVMVEAACNNAALPETYTDHKGRFSVEIGDRSSLFGGSARVSGAESSASFARYEPIGRREATVDLRGCELRLELTGFRAQTVSLDGKEGSSYVNLGTISLRRYANTEGDSISITTLQAPQKARKRYDQALKQLRGRKPHPAKATSELRTALAEYPAFAAAWTLLGELHWKSGALDEAEGALTKAVEADPAYVRPYLPLARIAYQGHRWDETLQLSDRLLRLNPYVMDAVFLRALASFQLGHCDTAERSALQVRGSNDVSRFPEVHYLLGLIRSKRGDFLGAAADFQDYLRVRPGSETAAGVTKQLQEWAALGVIPQ